MRKRIISPKLNATAAEQPWLNLERTASVEVTSEDNAFPIDLRCRRNLQKGGLRPRQEYKPFD